MVIQDFPGFSTWVKFSFTKTRLETSILSLFLLKSDVLIKSVSKKCENLLFNTQVQEESPILNF